MTRNHRRAVAWLVTAIATHGSIAVAQAGTAARAARAPLQPGDRVVLHVFGEPLLTDTATVDDQGAVALPRIGELHAGSMSIAEFRDTVKTRLRAVVREPAIEVNVLRRVVVGGEVMKPSIYYVDLPSTISEAIALAGGLRETANPRDVMLIRGADRTAVPDWDTNRTETGDLRSGDQVIVGRKGWFVLNFLPFVSVSASVVALIVSLRR
jgi:polysaccharide export outer membrane protein